jgi:hypothetical protein
MMGSDRLKKKYPNGLAILAATLRDTFSRGDKNNHPVELWDDEMLKMQWDYLSNMLKALRHGSSVDKVIATHRAQDGILPDQVLRGDAKKIRQHLQRIEREAEQAFSVLTMRLKNPKTREAMLIRLRTWRDAVEQPGSSPEKAGKYLFDAMDDTHMDMPSDGVTRGILKAYERAEFQQTDESEWPLARGIANGATTSSEWVYELAPQDVGEAREQLLPAPDIDKKTATAMARYAESLGDRDSDLMIKAMAKFAERAKNPRDQVIISIDELCEALGYTRNNSGTGGGASFRLEDKATVRARFEQLQAGYLTIYGAGKFPGGRRSVDVESRVLTIHDRAGQADIDGRVPEWTKVTVGFGDAWSVPLFDKKGRLTALLQEKTLAYDPIKQRLEKRIGKRLGWYWRMNRNAQATAARTVAQWIRDDVGDEPETYDRRQAERFEQALDTLRRDGQIGAWGYTGHQERIDRADGKQTRGWLERWLEREVIVEMPESLRMAYLERQPARKQAPAAPALPAPAAAPAGAKFGEAFREFRLARGISGLQASKEVGIHNTTLSQIETGRREPSDKHRQAMSGWMRDLTNRPDKLAERYANTADGRQPSTH